MVTKIEALYCALLPIKLVNFNDIMKEAAQLQQQTTQLATRQQIEITFTTA